MNYLNTHHDLFGSPPSAYEVDLTMAQGERSHSKRSNRNLNLSVLVLAIAAVWFIWREPAAFVLFGSFGIAFWSLWKIAEFFPFLSQKLGFKLTHQHVLVATVTLTMLTSAFDTPSYAIFLQGLEQYISNTLQQSGSGIDPTAITLVFNAIRIIFLLLVAAAALFAFNQAQQGNDWRPIATQIGLAVGIVLVIDVITFVFIGNGGGGGNP